MTVDDVKLALRIVTNEFDDELMLLMSAAQSDLGIAGVEVPTELDSLCEVAIITYCKMHFGNPENYERLKRSYDEQKAQLSMATGYTRWDKISG